MNRRLVSNLILIAIVLIAALFGIFLANNIEQPQTNSNNKNYNLNVDPQPSEYPDYDAIKGKNPDSKILKAEITSDCPKDGCVNSKPATVDLDGIYKKYLVKGKFSRAYLYFDALVDYSRPLTVWDDVIFQIGSVGGHLKVDEKFLPVPPGVSTKYLLDLRSVSYYANIKDKEAGKSKENISFYNQLQNDLVVDVHATISSDRPGRVMKEVSIYYECFEGSECSISEVK